MKSAEERFEAKYEPEPMTGCWLWTGSANPAGYGTFWLRGKRTGSHRAAWVLYRGEIPDGHHVCHTCDNPSCVNPSHLFVGTHSDNMQDRVSKGRGTLGVNHPQAKLTEADVRMVLASDLSTVELGRRLGVSNVTIGNIRRGKRWRSVAARSSQETNDADA